MLRNGTRKNRIALKIFVFASLITLTTIGLAKAQGHLFVEPPDMGYSALKVASRMMNPATFRSAPIDVCAGGDCSDAGLFLAASEACKVTGSGTRAIHWAIEGRQGKAEHWTGNDWALLPTGAIFKWIDCRR